MKIVWTIAKLVQKNVRYTKDSYIGSAMPGKYNIPEDAIIMGL